MKIFLAAAHISAKEIFDQDPEETEVTVEINNQRVLITRSENEIHSKYVPFFKKTMMEKMPEAIAKANGKKAK